MPCSHVKCGAAPRWQPALDVRSTERGKPTRVWFCHLGYCTVHRDASTVDTFLSDEGFTKIAKFMAEKGKRRPVRKLTTLAWEELGTAERTRLNAAQDKTTPDDSLPF